MLQVIGYVRKTGQYQGKDYDNTLIFASREPINENEQGTICETIKVKTSVYFQSCCSIGDLISPVYNRFGQVDGINVQKA